MKSFITSALIFAGLIAIAAMANVAMDTKVFHPHDGFLSWPDWAREFMFRRGTVPIIKIDDGWHLAQAVMFLSLGIAWFYAGRESIRLEFYLTRDRREEITAGWWFPIAALGVLLVLRALVHGLVFETLYPIL